MKLYGFSLPIAILGVALICPSARAELIAQWLANDLSGTLADGDNVEEWAESLTGETVLVADVNPPVFQSAATPGGTDAVLFNADGDDDQAVQTEDRAESPVADLTEFTVAVTFQPLAEGENPNTNDFWRNTAVVDADIGGINIDWGTSWRGTDSFSGGVGQPPNDISAYASVDGQDDLLEQWITGVYTVNGEDESHFSLLMAQDGAFGVTPEDERDLRVQIDPRGDFGVAFAVQRANTGGRNLSGAISEVRFYDETFDDAGAQAIAQEMHNLHVLGITDGPVRLQAGDADQDLDFDTLDLVQVQVGGKYLSGTVATWGEGDWNGAPGGEQGSPPPGDGLFDALDIVAALTAGTYLTGPYGAIAPGGSEGDGQTSVGYNPGTGEVFVDAPAGVELTSINIDSAGGIFTGQAAQNLGGSFDNDADSNIFKATFGGSFGSITFGNVAQTGLSQDTVLNDLTVVGSLAGGGALGDVDLIYVPEPTGGALLGLGLLVIMYGSRARRR